MVDSTCGTLYIVATPIGNLGDITFRAIEVLKTVDIIAAEDTRHSAKLLQHFGISAKLLAYHDHSNEQRLQKVLDSLLSGQSVALISDAGTPLISDPGYELVAKARGLGITVSPVPGACALIAALSISGLSSHQFIFNGFLPAKSSARCQVLSSLLKESRTVIFYESPHRIEDSLDDLQAVLGPDRSIALIRELTKTYETVLSGTVSEVIRRVEEDHHQKRGEFVLLVEGVKPDASAIEMTPEIESLMTALLEELPAKKAAAIVAKLHGMQKRQLYQWALDQK